VSESQRAAARQNVWLTIDHRNERLRIVRIGVGFRILHARERDLVRSADARELREPSLAIKLRERRTDEERAAVRVAREQVLFVDLVEVELRAKQIFLRADVLRKECALAKELLRERRHRKTGADRSVFDV